ncbi:hypothetical protein [Amycolatopsis sp. NPDC059021]
MTKELNTLRVGRGRRPELTGSELITMAVAQMLLRYDSERP